MIDYHQIKTDRQFKASTGKSKSEFAILLLDLEHYYNAKHGQSYEEYIEENVKETPKLKTLGEALFFVLFQMKNNLTWDSLIVVFSMSNASAWNNFNSFSKLLEETLEKKVMPKRHYASVKEFEEHTKSAEEIIFDGTETPIERPKGNDNQRVKYSEKKKTHTNIALVLSDKRTKI